MSDTKKVSELPVIPAVASDDLVLISQKVGAIYESKAIRSGNMTVDMGDIPASSGSWNSVYTTVRIMSGSWEESADITVLWIPTPFPRNDIGASSGNWNSAYITLGSSSGNWQDVRATVASMSGGWALSGTNTDISDLANASGNWNSAYTTVGANSGLWSTSGASADLGDIPASSGNWNSTYVTVRDTSGSWGGSADLGEIPATSGDWNDTRTTVASQSAVWALSGGGGWTGYYRNMYIDASSMVSNVTSGATAGTDEATVNKEMSDYFIFDTDLHQAVQFKITMPDEWDRSTVKAKFLWEAVTGSGDVVWGVKAVALGNDEAIDTAWGTAVTVTDTYTNPVRVEISGATGAVTVGNTPALGDLVYFYIYRDADNGSDTFTQTAKLLGVEIQYKEGASAPSIW